MIRQSLFMNEPLSLHRLVAVNESERPYSVISQRMEMVTNLMDLCQESRHLRDGFVRKFLRK
ncbi:hypothetical protein, partial [Paenibacillus xylanexedens]|uniref:hypothetical protein n=1 Tax=Paenibacillus xylanexedens TaxID=528191 RepID=UPI001C92CA70